MERSEIERHLEELHPVSWGWALSCCERNRDFAEDVLQMTYLKVIEGKARFDGRSRFKTWLFGVIRNTALEYSRWRSVRRRIVEAFARRPFDTESNEAERRVEQREQNRMLIGALRRLARRQREVLELVFYHDLTIDEAAEAMGISVGAARVHYARGKQNLKEAICDR
ncbi:MAG TPA: RNA polymerase sigma factor [Thermoanaerobaculia bacterium]